MERLCEELHRRDRELRTVAARASTELQRVKKPLEDRVVRLQQELEQAELYVREPLSGAEKGDEASRVVDRRD